MTYTIERLGHKGDGIASGPLFAPRTLPGEVVAGTPDGDRLTDVRIVEPAPTRIKAPCAHYNSCGGCALQHASDDFVSGWKQGVVETALRAQGITAQVLAPVTSAPRTRRRATLTARRTKKGALVGFHARGSDTITPVPNCMILHPDLLATVPTLESITRLAASRSGEVRYALTLGDTGVDCDVQGAKPLDGPLRMALAPFGTAFARLTWDGEPILVAQAPGQRFGTARIVPPPGAFLQATPDGEAALVAAVQSALKGCKSVVDLFAGCGTFSFPMAKTASVHAVEGDHDLLAALDHGIRHNAGLKPMTCEVRDLFRNPFIQDDLEIFGRARFDGAIIDPPRAGAEAQTRHLAASGIPRIAAISCNPVTFARDANLLLGAGYTMGPVQVVDQFRWSPHIEIVTPFTKD